MKLDRDSSSGNVIRAFSAGRLIIGSATFTAPLILTAEQVIADWLPPPPDRLEIHDLQPALDLQPEVILLGTGVHQVFPSTALLAEILGRGIGIEVMGTGAACRTFNILAAEQRRVVAALMVV